MFRFVFLLSFVFSVGFAAPLPAKLLVDNDSILTVERFEQMLSDFACEPYTLQTFFQKYSLRKSHVVEEVYFLLSQHETFQKPANTALFRFFDLTGKEFFYPAAQVLRAMYVLESHGLFGTKIENDPFLTEKETHALLKRAFVQGKCGFVPQTDRDFDGVLGDLDLCPILPARGTLDGCPMLSFFKTPRAKVSRVLISLLDKTEFYVFWELTQLKVGDVFRAVFLHPRTQEVLRESLLKSVEN